MDIHMSVNRVSSTQRSTIADINGVPTEVVVPITEVELVDPTGTHGSLVLRLSTADPNVQRFTEGGTAIITV
jgi:hypothetical protein